MMIVDIVVKRGPKQIGSGSIEIDEGECKLQEIDPRKLAFRMESAINVHVPDVRVHFEIDPDRCNDPSYGKVNDDGDSNET